MACLIDQNPSHRLSRCREEVLAVGEDRRTVAAYQPQVRFMNQCRGLQGLPRLLLVQLDYSQLPQLFVNEWQEPLRCDRIAGCDLLQDSSDSRHRAKPSADIDEANPNPSERSLDRSECNE